MGGVSAGGVGKGCGDAIAGRGGCGSIALLGLASDALTRAAGIIGAGNT
jgi:hypothetical protein